MWSESYRAHCDISVFPWLLLVTSLTWLRTKGKSAYCHIVTLSLCVTGKSWGRRWRPRWCLTGTPATWSVQPRRVERGCTRCSWSCSSKFAIMLRRLGMAQTRPTSTPTTSDGENLSSRLNYWQNFLSFGRIIWFCIYQKAENKIIRCLVRHRHSTGSGRKENVQPLHLQPEPRHQRVGRGQGPEGEFLWRTSRRNPVTLSNYSQAWPAVVPSDCCAEKINILLKLKFLT